MMRRRFFWRLLGSSLMNRKSRVLVAVVSLTFGVSLASALMNITLDVGERLSGEMRGYGANLLLTSTAAAQQVGLGSWSLGPVSGEGLIGERVLAELEAQGSSGHIVGYAPILYAVMEANTQRVVLSGVWFDAILRVNPSWKYEGAGVPGKEDTDSAVVGAAVAERLGLRVGDHVEVGSGGRTRRLRVAGVLSTGWSEDSQIFVSLRLAQELTGRYGVVNTVQVRCSLRGAELRAAAARLAEAIPEVEAKVVSQVAEAEEAFLGKIQTATALLTACVLVASAFAVMSTASTTVLERRNEIGLMKALGAGSRGIARLFLAEALFLGVAGGVAGYGLGVGISAAMWMRIFGTPIAPRPVTLPAAVAIAAGVSLLAFVLPMRQAVAIDPAVTLRGE